MMKSRDKSTLAALLKRIDALELDVARLKAENMALRAENERLKLEIAAAKKNSRNSSKPPSSDIVKPPPPGGKGKRGIGAQLGHKSSFRSSFTPEQLDESHVFAPQSMQCSQCGGALHPTPDDDYVRQQIDLRPNPLIRREFRATAYACSACGAFHREKLPEHIAKADFIGDNLAATLAFLNGTAHASLSALSTFMKDVCGEPVSRGQIAKTLQRVSAALEEPYLEAFASLQAEPVLNIDETGHRENGKRFWTWVFRAVNLIVFHIDKTRSAGVLELVLGIEFKGVIGSDYFSAYHKYLKDSGCTAQFCLAHLIRELRFLKEHPTPETRRYAIRTLAAMRRLFRIYHRCLEDPNGDRNLLVKAGERLRRAILFNPPSGKAENIAKRFLDNGDAYLRFITNPKVEPTNNRAEQAIRQVVIDRAASQGTRSQKGRAYKERLWTVLATCTMQGASAYQFIRNALHTYTYNSEPPSLINSKYL